MEALALVMFIPCVWALDILPWLEFWLKSSILPCKNMNL